MYRTTGEGRKGDGSRYQPRELVLKDELKFAR